MVNQQKSIVWSSSGAPTRQELDYNVASRHVHANHKYGICLVSTTIFIWWNGFDNSVFLFTNLTPPKLQKKKKAFSVSQCSLWHHSPMRYLLMVRSQLRFFLFFLSLFKKVFFQMCWQSNKASKIKPSILVWDFKRKAMHVFFFNSQENESCRAALGGLVQGWTTTTSFAVVFLVNCYLASCSGSRHFRLNSVSIRVVCRSVRPLLKD